MRTVLASSTTGVVAITMRARNLSSENFAVQVEVTCLCEDWRRDPQVNSLFVMLQRRYEIVEVTTC